MRVALAERLLAKIMEWSTDEVTRERPMLQNLANFKYDEYQQFSPGIRFIESLVLWLKQFDTIEERKIAYEFFKRKIIFISNAEMYHLVSLAFPDIINVILIEKAAREIPLDKYQIRKIINSNQYKAALDKSLFLGLSDGARIDQFRRISGVNNEQVSSTYHISKAKADDMLKELKSRLKETDGHGKLFNTLFLLDDFTASGVSYFIPETGKGKIYKCLTALFESDKNGDDTNPSEKENHLVSLVNVSDLEIHIIFYVATEISLENLRSKMQIWMDEKNHSIKITVSAIQIIRSEIRDEVLAETAMIDITKRYFDEKIVDNHFRKGKYDNPYLGFNECALPLILAHNSPNNSLPILWMSEDYKYRGLFPRISRHR